MQDMTRKPFYYWVPVIAWCSVIFYLSSLPHLATDLGVFDLVLRKIAHMVEYGVLFLLLERALRQGSSDRRVITASRRWAAVFAFLYAVSDEFHQSFVPGRGPSVIDVGIDSAGIVIAMAGAHYMRLTRRVLFR